MLCSDGPHSVWQYALHTAYSRFEGWNLRDDAAWDGVLCYQIDRVGLEIITLLRLSWHSELHKYGKVCLHV